MSPMSSNKPLSALLACLLLPACASGTMPPDPPAASGGPVVVLQAGLGDDSGVWQRVRAALPTGTVTLVAPDRPGYGRTPATAAPRDPCTIAAEQHDLLVSRGFKPPYLLVGHSIGGLYQYAFARLYPTEVKGLLLLEGTHPQHLARLNAQAPASAAMIRLARLAMGRTAGAEFDAQARCTDAWDSEPPLQVPTRVLTRRDFSGLEQGSFEQAFRELQQDWLRRTGAARVELVAGTGHYLQRDQPQAVAQAIIEMAR